MYHPSQSFNTGNITSCSDRDFVIFCSSCEENFYTEKLRYHFKLIFLIKGKSFLISKTRLILYFLPPNFLSSWDRATHYTPVTCYSRSVGVPLCPCNLTQLPYHRAGARVQPVIPEYCLGTVDFLHYSTCIILLYWHNHYNKECHT